MVVSVVAPLLFYIFYTKKQKKFLSENPNKSFISFVGGEGAAGVHIHDVLSQSLDNEYSKMFPQAGTFSINAGEVELEVERVTMSYNPIVSRTTYTFHGKVIKKFHVEAGKKYKLKFDKKIDDFVLNIS
jgi:hypothetical protein